MAFLAGTSSVSDQKKPAFDEQTLAKLLEAAYVLQEHNRERRKSELERELKSTLPAGQAASKISASAPGEAKSSTPSAASSQDYQAVLDRVLEMQQRIQAGHLSRQSSLMLLAEQALDIAHGSGASIAFLDGDDMHYEAVAGITMMPGGAVIPVEDAMCAISVRTGEVFRCAEVNPAFLPDIEQCRHSGVQAFIAVPVFLEDEVAGALEVYYSQPKAFSEQDVHACQLVAGLVAEVPAQERAADLSSLHDEARSQAATPFLQEHPAWSGNATNANRCPSSKVTLCQKCAHELLDHEQFCVECGTRRMGADGVPAPLNTAILPKTSAVPTIPEGDAPAFANSLGVSHGAEHDLSWAKALKDQIPELFGGEEIPPHADLESSEPEFSAGFSESKIIAAESNSAEKTDDEPIVVEESAAPESRALSKPPAAADWSSALSARAFLEQLAGNKPRNAAARLWNERRGDIYLAIAVLLVACVIRWGIWSGPSVNATARPPNVNAAHNKSPDADLSAFDRMLISLGLAEAPEPPADKGNPSTQVWVDLHTALYYCPGADMYGKTATGRYATQREAQLDSFEPAYRKVCE